MTCLEVLQSAALELEQEALQGDDGDLRREQLKARAVEKAKAEEERESKKVQKASKAKAAPKPRGRPRKASEPEPAEVQPAEVQCPAGESRKRKRAQKPAQKQKDEPVADAENPELVDEEVLGECFNAMRRFENAKYDKFTDTLHHHEFQTVKLVPYWDREDCGLKVPIDASRKYGQRC